MVKKTHVQGGLLVSLLTNPIISGSLPSETNILYKVILTVIYIGGSCAGSLLPDVDMKSSYISKTVPILHKMYGKRFKHRGFTHSLLALFIMFVWSRVLIALVEGEFGITLFVQGVFIGCVSHVVLDLFTKEGVSLFSPLGKAVSIANLKTSSRKEKKLNNYLEFAIYMSIGVNMYLLMHQLGIVM